MTRTCGTCTACCTLLGISALGKAPGVPCGNLIPAGRLTGKDELAAGCGIYDERPTECRTFSCWWRLEGEDATRAPLMNDDDRPDRVGVMVCLSPRNGAPDVVYTTRPGAMSEARPPQLLGELYGNGAVVLVDGGERSIYVTSEVNP